MDTFLRFVFLWFVAGSLALGGSQPCPDGQFIDKTFQCQPCPENTYRNESMDICLPCGDGLVTREKGATNISECVPCGPGMFKYWGFCKGCKEDSKEAQCKINSTVDFVSENTCEEFCPTPHPNYTWCDSCQPCPLNTYKEEGETECKPCPNGTETKTIGAYNESECTDKKNPGQDDKGNVTSATVIIVTLSTSMLVAGLVLLYILRRRRHGMDSCCTYTFAIKTQRNGEYRYERTGKAQIEDSF